MNYVGSLDGEADKNAGGLGCSSTSIVLSFVNNYCICGECMCVCECICMSLCFPVTTLFLGFNESVFLETMTRDSSFQFSSVQSLSRV